MDLGQPKSVAPWPSCCPIELTLQEKVECWFEFCNFEVRFSVYCLTFCFEFYNHHILKTKQQKNIWRDEKVIIRLNFNPGLAITGFWTILPRFQQVNLTWAHDPIENQCLVSGQLQKNTWPRVHLNPRYGQVILVSRYLVLTGANWS